MFQKRTAFIPEPYRKPGKIDYTKGEETIQKLFYNCYTMLGPMDPETQRYKGLLRFLYLAEGKENDLEELKHETNTHLLVIKNKLDSIQAGPCRGIRILRAKRKMIKTKYLLEQMKQNKELCIYLIIIIYYS